MERIYCDYFCKYSSGIPVDNYDPDATACECTWRMFETFCVFSLDEINEMEEEDVFCPFWDIDSGWIDIRELGVYHGEKSE